MLKTDMQLKIYCCHCLIFIFPNKYYLLDIFGYHCNTVSRSSGISPKDVAPDVRLNALVLLLHRSGARIAEILALDLVDIDSAHRRFQVIGKGNKQRWCFYSEDAQQALDKYLRHYRHQDCPALFTAQRPLTGQVSRWNYRTVYTYWHKFTQTEPLLQGVRIHDLRHTFATERVGLMGIEELRALMGHENIQTTLRYQKVTSARAEAAAQNAFMLLQAGV